MGMITDKNGYGTFASQGAQIALSMAELALVPIQSSDFLWFE